MINKAHADKVIQAKIQSKRLAHSVHKRAYFHALHKRAILIAIDQKIRQIEHIRSEKMFH